MTLTPKCDILSMDLTELTALMQQLGEKPFRSKQIFKWLHQKQVTTFSDMSDLSQPLREKLEQHCSIAQIVEQRRQRAKDGTMKFLFSFEDEATIESVFMRHSYGNSLCISTQVGCQMGCTFCASTIEGKLRNLTAGEMLAQVYAAARLTESHVDSLVIMGIGEPLDNFENVVRFLELLRHPDGLNLSLRHVSLSTCGIVPMIDQLAERNYQLTLSISLHAYNNATRSQIMPVNNAYPIEALMDACKRYFEKTHRRISYEYALIAGVNDSLIHAQGLIKLVRGQNCHVNLIPINPVKERNYTKTSQEKALAFCSALGKGGISATIRRELGGEIEAACGQLRRSTKQ